MYIRLTPKQLNILKKILPSCNLRASQIQIFQEIQKALENPIDEEDEEESKDLKKKNRKYPGIGPKKVDERTVHVQGPAKKVTPVNDSEEFKEDAKEEKQEDISELRTDAGADEFFDKEEKEESEGINVGPQYDDSQEEQTDDNNKQEETKQEEQESITQRFKPTASMTEDDSDLISHENEELEEEPLEQEEMQDYDSTNTNEELKKIYEEEMGSTESAKEDGSESKKSDFNKNQNKTSQPSERAATPDELENVGPFGVIDRRSRKPY